MFHTACRLLDTYLYEHRCQSCWFKNGQRSVCLFIDRVCLNQKTVFWRFLASTSCLLHISYLVHVFDKKTSGRGVWLQKNGRYHVDACSALIFFAHYLLIYFIDTAWMWGLLLSSILTAWQKHIIIELKFEFEQRGSSPALILNGAKEGREKSKIYRQNVITWSTSPVGPTILARNSVCYIWSLVIRTL